MTRHLQRTDELLDTHTIEIGVGTTSLGIQLEGDDNLWHLLLQHLSIDGTVGTEHVVTQGVKSDAAIHGSGIDIDISHALGEVFGHCALSARRVAVNGNSDLFHILI